MIVGNAMHTEVVTAKVSDDMRSVVQKMVTHHCGVIPIVDDENSLVGVIATRDIMMPMFASEVEVFQEDVHAMNFEEMEQKYLDVLKSSVTEIMTVKPLSLDTDCHLLKAASIMGAKNLRRMPVTKDGKLVGLVSIGDINRELFLRYTTVGV